MMSKPTLTPLDDEASNLKALLGQPGHRIIWAWPSPHLAGVLAATIDQQTSLGRNTAVLSETGQLLARMQDIDALLHVRAEPFGAVYFTRQAFLAKLEDRIEEAWFDNLALVLIPVAEESLYFPFEWEHLCYRLQDRCIQRALPFPQFIFICAPRGEGEPALRKNFPIFSLNSDVALGTHDAHEITFIGADVEKLWWTIWAAEDVYADKFVHINADSDYGAEGPLAYYAGLYRIDPSRYEAPGSVPIEDRLESFQHRVSQENKRPWREVMNGNQDGIFVRRHPASGKTISDTACNPWRSMRGISGKGGKAMLLNVVVPPSLLRGYLIANAAYFANLLLAPLTPRMQNGIFDAVTQLFLRLANGAEIQLVEVQKILSYAESPPVAGQKPHVLSNPFEKLKTHIGQYFGAAVANRLHADSRQTWRQDSKHSGRFIRQTWIALSSCAEQINNTPWLREYSVIHENRRDETLDRLRGDHIYQNYLPGQTKSVAGKQFKVSSVDTGSGLVVLRHTGGILPINRNTIRLSITDPTPENRTLLESVRNDYASVCLEKSVFEVPFSIEVTGWYEGLDFSTTWRRNRVKVPPRIYTPGRALRVSLTNREGTPLLSPGARLAVIQWLNEAALTLLPESHRYFIAGSFVEETNRPATEPSNEIVPVILLGERASEQDKSAIWIFEDSHADMGIVGACFDRLEWLLSLCLDYLTWRQGENEPGPVTPRQGFELNHERLSLDVFCYGNAKPDKALDFSALKTALEQCGLFGGRASITAQRHEALVDSVKRINTHSIGNGISSAGENTPSTHTQDRTDSLTNHHCDFCGIKIDGAQADQLDGLMRCLDCGRNAVDRIENANQLSQTVKSTLETEFGIHFKKAIEINFVSPQEIAAQQGEDFIPTSDFDRRSVGLAVGGFSVDSRESQKIFIERGHSQVETAMTIAHELTHIWQFEQLDYQRLEEEHGMSLIEGHASWAEIACAQLMARSMERSDETDWLTGIERRKTDLLMRDDAYGIGYRMLIEHGVDDRNGFDLMVSV